MLHDPHNSHRLSAGLKYSRLKLHTSTTAQVKAPHTSVSWTWTHSSVQSNATNQFKLSPDWELYISLFL